MADLDLDLEELKNNKFAHLLKPIRDLQDNFNIDLAHELEEYLEQLENAQFAFEGARHVMVDFAEAALLIQGSAVVFSKKVEYLYNLTYQALEAVKGRRRPDGEPLDGDAGTQPVAAARGRGAAAARAADEDEDDGLERFWDAEPMLKELGDLDLAPDEGVMANAGLAVRPPAALLALEDHAPGTGSGTSGAKGDGDAGVYRLQQCIVHCSGALLLDPRDGDLYDSQLRFIGPQPRQDKGLEQLIEAHRMEQPTQLFPLPATQAQPPGVPVGQQPAPGDSAAPMDMDPGQAHDFDNDDGGGYGGGGDWPSDDEGAPPAADEGAAGKDAKAAEGAASAGAADGAAVTADYADGRPQRRRAESEGGSASVGGAQQADGEAAEEEVFDPYKPLDPTAKSRLADRPLVVRKPRKVVHRASGKAAGAAGSAAVAAAAGGLVLPEFSYCLAFLRPAHAAKQEAEPGKCPGTHLKNRRERVVKAKDVPAPVFDASDAAMAVAADEAAAGDPADDAVEPLAEQQPYGYDDDDDGGGGYGGGGGSDLDDDLDPAAAGRDGFGGDAGDAWHDPAGGDANGTWPGNRELYPGMVPPMGGLGGLEVPRGADGEEPSYEELCRAHMESMLMAAAAREVQTDLARRVSNWRQRIDPLLKAEESRPAFDIQDYGELILSRLSNLQITDGSPEDEQQQQLVASRGGVRPHINFSKVAADLQKFEVSRLFSAMLQLINNRNVAIYKADTSRVPPGEVPDEPLQLELLSTDMYHKTMGARLAAPAGGGALPGADNGDHDDGENRGATQPAAARRAGGGGRGKQGAKRAKRVAAEPLGDVNMDD